MKSSRITYLSLGSNLGNRLGNIQKAIDLIAQKVGEVQKIASVYKTDSWGFLGNHFYNTCIKVATYYTPEIMMENLLSIEDELGRIRKSDNRYSDRIIDIDMVLFEQEIISLKRLVVPHPRMLERKFVLIPLVEMAKDKIHPLEKKPLSVCLEDCPDTSSVLRISEKLNRPKTMVYSKYLHCH